MEENGVLRGWHRYLSLMASTQDIALTWRIFTTLACHFYFNYYHNGASGPTHILFKALVGRAHSQSDCDAGSLIGTDKSGVLLKESNKSWDIMCSRLENVCWRLWFERKLGHCDTATPLLRLETASSGPGLIFTSSSRNKHSQLPPMTSTSSSHQSHQGKFQHKLRHCVSEPTLSSQSTSPTYKQHQEQLLAWISHSLGVELGQMNTGKAGDLIILTRPYTTGTARMDEDVGDVPELNAENDAAFDDGRLDDSETDLDDMDESDFDDDDGTLIQTPSVGLCATAKTMSHSQQDALFGRQHPKSPLMMNTPTQSMTAFNPRMTEQGTTVAAASPLRNKKSLLSQLFQGDCTSTSSMMRYGNPALAEPAASDNLQQHDIKSHSALTSAFSSHATSSYSNSVAAQPCLLSSLLKGSGSKPAACSTSQTQHVTVLTGSRRPTRSQPTPSASANGEGQPQSGLALETNGTGVPMMDMTRRAIEHQSHPYQLPLRQNPRAASHLGHLSPSHQTHQQQKPSPSTSYSTAASASTSLASSGHGSAGECVKSPEISALQARLCHGKNGTCRKFDLVPIPMQHLMQLQQTHPNGGTDRNEMSRVGVHGRVVETRRRAQDGHVDRRPGQTRAGSAGSGLDLSGNDAPKFYDDVVIW